MENYVDFAVQKAVELLAIDSPTGYPAEAEEFVLREFRALGFAAERTAKGGILIDLGGESTDDALLLEAHADTLGGMVAEIKGDGRLRIVNVGGMNANNAEAENCRVVTKFSGSYEGTLQLINASVHVNGDYASTKRSWDTVEVVLDEAVEFADDVKVQMCIRDSCRSVHCRPAPTQPMSTEMASVTPAGTEAEPPWPTSS